MNKFNLTTICPPAGVLRLQVSPEIAAKQACWSVYLRNRSRTEVAYLTKHSVSKIYFEIMGNFFTFEDLLSADAFMATLEKFQKNHH
jgi:hypothetical protein